MDVFKVLVFLLLLFAWLLFVIIVAVREVSQNINNGIRNFSALHGGSALALLKENGTPLKTKTARVFLKTIEEACPWFLEEGHHTVPQRAFGNGPP